jgi:hypothetical protein
MIIDPADVSALATNTLVMRQAEQDRLRHINRYMRGRHDPPYAPRGVNAEYRWIMRKSRRNFLPLVVSVISQNLHIDGYRPSGTTTNEIAAPQQPTPGWDAFRANRMISRQHGVHRSVVKYGAAYIVAPHDRFLRGRRRRRMAAVRGRGPAGTATKESEPYLRLGLRRECALYPGV